MRGGEATPTTNNRMELMAAIRALESLTRPSAVRLYTDSSYVRGGVTGWLAGWKRNGWKTASKQPVKNEDLWRRLDDATRQHEIQWLWVKGHAGQSRQRAGRRTGQSGHDRGRGRRAPGLTAPPRNQKLALAELAHRQGESDDRSPRIHLNGSPATQDDISITERPHGGPVSVSPVRRRSA